jgi:cell division protease FtsH
LAAGDERTLGLQQPIRDMHVDDIHDVAYHEAGHAVVAHYLQPENRIAKATIIRRGHALGYVQPLPREERHQLHARQIETDIMVSLGSRAVEEEFLDTKMAGASSDLVHASSRALIYCARLGMGSSLLVVEPQQSALNYPMPVARIADSLLETLMAETKRLLHEKEAAVHAVANALIERRELIGPELDEVFAEVEAAHPEMARRFERKLITLPRLFQDPSIAAGGGWPVDESAAAAVDGPAASRGWVDSSPVEPGRAWWPAPQDVPPPRA